jgi:D-alanyl-D-alanine carboxypeptidase
LRGRAIVGLILLVTVWLCAFAVPAQAQIGSERYASLVMDARTGAILSQVDGDEPRYPASLTKMMTLYMLFEGLRDRRVSLDQLVPVSPHAASMSPTKLGLVPSSRITVEQAVLGLVTLSANDAAAALGELLGGDEGRFAQMMTLRARALGMSNTTFRNASGLPDPDQLSTAHDMAILARHLIQDFPQEYHYFSTPSFTYGRRVILNHDHMLQTYPGADGLKTGYTRASGLNLVTSAVRGDVRLIGVVFGAATGGERDLHMASLLDQGFERMDVPINPRHDSNLMARGTPSPSAVSRLPNLIGTASALALPLPLPAMPPKFADARTGHPALRWAAMLGTYPTETLARRAVAAARHGTDGDGDVRLESVSMRGHAHAWRVSIAGLSQVEAQGACVSAARLRISCAIERADGQIASR